MPDQITFAFDAPGLEAIPLCVEILPVINGVRVLEDLFDGSVVNLGALRDSRERSGPHLIFTCACGIAECGGWEPVEVGHRAGRVSWTLSSPGQYSWTFDAEQYRSELEVLELLLDGLDDCRALQVDGRDHGSLCLLAAARGRTELVDAALRAGVAVDAQDQRHRTALYHAVANGHHAIVDRLLQAGADANLTDDEGVTALHLAADRGDAVATHRLLEAGATPDPIQRLLGLAPLHLAARQGSSAVVGRLLQAGADAHIADGAGWSALDWALFEGSDDGVELLRARGVAARSEAERQRDRLGDPSKQTLSRAAQRRLKLD